MDNRQKASSLVAATAIAVALAAPAAYAAEPEAGVTFFEDGSCQEADGTPGMSMPDGQCVTIEDYDYLFSYENLDSIPSLTSPTGQSIAEEAGLTDADNPASERPLGAGLVPATQERTFADNFQPTGWQTNPFYQPEVWIWADGGYYIL